MNVVAISQYLKSRMNRDEKGVTTIEYAIMLIAVAAVVLIAGGTLGRAVSTLLSSIGTAL